MPKIAFLAALLLALLALGCQSPTRDEDLKTRPVEVIETAEPVESNTFEPASGVTCNRITQVCAFKEGPTVGLTRLFFGDAAADELSATRGDTGRDPLFKPSGGGFCDTLVTTCYGEDGASAELTTKYFGHNAAARLAKRQADPQNGIYRPNSYITCDRMSGVCYDRMGAGWGATRMYLDAEAAEKLAARMRP